jgi:hypothetical protein
LIFMSFSKCENAFCLFLQAIRLPILSGSSSKRLLVNSK